MVEGKLRVACAVCAGLYALAMGFLVVAIYQEDHSVNWALAVMCALGLVAAALVIAVPRRWPGWVAAAYAILTTIADAPHQLGELAHPTGHAPASAAILLIGLAAIVASLMFAAGGALTSRARV